MRLVAKPGLKSRAVSPACGTSALPCAGAKNPIPRNTRMARNESDVETFWNHLRSVALTSITTVMNTSAAKARGSAPRAGRILWM